MTFTVKLPKEIYLRAERYAKFTGRDIDDVVASVIEHGLPLPDREFPDFSQISDAEVVKLAAIGMETARRETLSGLLHDQQAGALTPAARAELDALMSEYNYLLMVHANANAEAVRRGLLPKQSP